MGKRLVRIFEAEIPSQIPSLLNLELNLILKNNLTLHGKIIQLKNTEILFQDMLYKKHKIMVSSVSEIIFDKVSEN